MTTPKSLPPVEYLRQCFHYDPETGVLYWGIRPREHFANERGWRTFNSRFAGEEAGKQKSGYKQIGIGGSMYMVHRLIWSLFYGVELGDAEIDHKDCDPTNNRIANLRLATQSDNQRNKRRIIPGIKGVNLCRGTRWRARIRHNGTLIHLGYFNTEHEVSSAYYNAAKEFFGEFARRS